MEFDIGVFKKHPYLIGGIVLVVGGYIFYKIYKSSAAASSTDLSSSNALLAAQSAQQLTQAQYQAQQDLQNSQTSGQIAVIGASYQGQVDLAKQGQSVYDDYLAAQLTLAQGTNDTTVAVANIQSNTTLGVASIEGATTLGVTQITADVYQAKINADVQNATAIDALALSAIKTNRSSTGIGQILASLTGGPSPATPQSTSKGISIAGIGGVSF